MNPPRSATRARVTALVVMAVLVALGVWGGRRLKVVTDIRHFLPTVSDRRLSEISAALADSPLTRTSVLAIEGADEAKVLQSATRLAHALAEHPEVEWVRTGIDETLESAVTEIYFPRRGYLQAHDLSDAGLADAAAQLERALAGPRGSLLRTWAPSDPLLSFSGFLDGLRRAEGDALETRDGQFFSPASGAAVMFLRTRSSAFASGPQAELQADIEEIMRAIRAEVDPSATLSQSGLARFAIATERSTVADVTRVSVVSTICIVVLFVLMFGQLRAVVLTYAPVVLGVGGGILGCSLFVDEVHGLTLVFGSALLGVGVDYAVHLMFHFGHRGTRSTAQVVTQVRPGLLLGAATTAVGLAGLAITTFPGMRELALFGAVGIGGSVAMTLLLIPAFGARPPDRGVRLRLVAGAQQILDHVQRWGARAWGVFAVIAVVGIAGLPSLTWSDGLRALYQVDAELAAEDTRVRELTGAIDMSRMVLASGRDVPEALEKNHAVHAVVDRAAADGEIAGYRSVRPWLPAESWQRENLERLRAPDLPARLDAAFVAQGFREGAFAASFDDVRAAPPPVTFADLQGTPLQAIVDPFVLDLDDEVVVVTWLRGDVPPALRDELLAMQGVELFDQQQFLDAAYGRYRVEMIQMLALGLAAVVFIIAARYRRVRPTAAAFLPAVAGALGVLGVVAWVDGSANLLHAAALLLVCAMGVDYGVFMVESRKHRGHDAVTLASCGLAAVTTVLSFGVLAMSSNPALASVGRAVAVGVLCALVTTPAAATLRIGSDRA